MYHPKSKCCGADVRLFSSIDCPERKGGKCRWELDAYVVKCPNFGLKPCKLTKCPQHGSKITIRSSCCRFPVLPRIGSDGTGFLVCENCGMGCSPVYETGSSENKGGISEAELPKSCLTTSSPAAVSKKIEPLNISSNWRGVEISIAMKLNEIINYLNSHDQT